jgi:hypothetical protein
MVGAASSRAHVHQAKAASPHLIVARGRAGPRSSGQPPREAGGPASERAQWRHEDRAAADRAATRRRTTAAAGPPYRPGRLSLMHTRGS